MNKQPEITDATREAFVTAFFKLASIKNINQITIREITNLAGYNRTTFYRYFEDVYSLIEYAEDELLKNVRETMEKQMGECVIGERRFFEIVIQCFHKNADRVTILISEQNRSHFIRRIRENMPPRLNRRSLDGPKMSVIKDIYFYGIMYAIMINLQNRNALPDNDLLDIIQTLFDNWYRPEISKSL